MHISQPVVSQGSLCQAQKAGAAGRLLSYLFLVTKPFGAFLLSLINSAMEYPSGAKPTNEMYCLVISNVWNGEDEVLYQKLEQAIAHAEDIKYDPETCHCNIYRGEDEDKELVWYSSL